MRELFASWPTVSAYLAGAERIYLLSDFDGTLTPIVERPELAVLPDVTRDVLACLAASRRYYVGIISGRALADLKARVNLPGIVYAGNHGLEIESPGIAFVHADAAARRNELQILGQVLQKELAGIDGVLVENKGLTLSVHYRLVDPGRVGAVSAIFERVVRVPRLLGQVRLTEGKKVWEVRPALDWDKGKAISVIVERQKQVQPHVRTGVVYLGDDHTDESAFQVVREREGLAIFVGGPPAQTAAGYMLRSPADVLEFLRRLVEMESGKGVRKGSKRAKKKSA